ncbi:MAG: hypothetical protein JEZ00_21445, partial [Anaerolineaceae bacterium]|nr:hypothetical protein [Anaerolineaceae bacterium]
ITSSAPDNVSKNLKLGNQTVSGLFDTKQMILDIHSNRIDWVLKSAEVEPLDSIGSYDEIAKEFIGCINKWFNIMPDLSSQRIAYAGQLIFPVASRIEGYEVLNNLLDYVEIDPVNSTDFQYQINRPTESSVIDGLMINKLSSWSAITQAIMTIALPSSGVTQQQKGIYCFLQFDVNTFESYTNGFDCDKSNLVFNELITIALDLIANGDKRC